VLGTVAASLGKLACGKMQKLKKITVENSAAYWWLK